MRAVRRCRSGLGEGGGGACAARGGSCRARTARRGVAPCATRADMSRTHTPTPPGTRKTRGFDHELLRNFRYVSQGSVLIYIYVHPSFTCPISKCTTTNLMCSPNQRRAEIVPRHGSPSGARVAVRARRARADLAAWRGAGGPPRQGGGGLSLKGALRVQPGARHAAAQHAAARARARARSAPARTHTAHGRWRGQALSTTRASPTST